MNVPALIALLLALAAWALFGTTGVNLLSGYMEERTCQTGCVKTLFFAAVAAGLGGLILSIIALFRPSGRVVSVIALLLSLAICSVAGFLYVAGNFL